MRIEDRCFKFVLPNGEILDITPNVINKAIPYLQTEAYSNEACGYIVGYENGVTSNITLMDISIPQENDFRARIFCKLKDIHHKIFLKKHSKMKNYYMGTWHTHPQTNPHYSQIDYKEWLETLQCDKTGCNYAFFIIFGTIDFKIWCGCFDDNNIIELTECQKVDGLYLKE